MADEQKNLPLSAEISAEISSASSTDEIQAALSKAREAQPPEPAKPEPPAKTAPELYTDTFTIGGREVEISGPDPADVLRQFKAAVTAFELGRSQQPAPKLEAPAKTSEEIQAEKFELESNFRLGKISAKEYLEKSGAVDDYFKERGIDPQGIKELLEERKGARQVKSWEQATTEFTSKFSQAGTPWPGGPRVLDLMGKTLIELGLGDKPAPESLQQAYDHLTAKGWDLIEIGREDAAAREGDEPQPKKPIPPPAPPPKKRLGASGLFNVSGNAGGKEIGKQAPVAPKIEPDDSPETIVEKWKAATIAAGRNPDDALRETYGVSRVQ